ncbi:MAG: hypothetical protein VKK07_01905 [Merismopediaceae bacterium]|nr:hypothetical protein [Merismopediaceae bacterium]
MARSIPYVFLLTLPRAKHKYYIKHLGHGIKAIAVVGLGDPKISVNEILTLH